MAAGKGVGKLFKAAFEGSGALIRKCKGWAAKQADNLAGKSRKLSPEESWRRARAARDAEIANPNLPIRPKKARVVTGATDPQTGMSAAGRNFPAGQGGWGCAEKNALDNLNAQRRAADPNATDLGPGDVYFSEAKVEVDGTVTDMPICARNCQRFTDVGQYPPHTRADPDGPWGIPRTGSERWGETPG